MVEREPVYRQHESVAAFAPELFGLDQAELDALGDDRIGRALDHLFDADRGIRVDDSGVRVLRRLGSEHIAWADVAWIGIGEQVEHADEAHLGGAIVGLAVGGVTGTGLGSDLVKAATLAVASQSRRHAAASIEDAVDQLGEDRPGSSPPLAVPPARRGPARARALRCDGPMGWEFARAVAVEAHSRGIEVRIA